MRHGPCAGRYRAAVLRLAVPVLAVLAWGAAFGAVAAAAESTAAAGPDEAAAAASRLPTDQPYQQVLRDYLGTLTVDDLSITGSPAEPEALDKSGAAISEEEARVAPFEAVAGLPDDAKYQLWLLNHHYLRPDATCLRVPPEYYTLAGIEGERGPLMPLHRGSRLGDSSALAFFATWSYAGNPYRGMRALKLRAFARLVVDLVMHEAAHARGVGVRSDYMGGTLIWLASDYGQVRDVLPPEVQAAYETGLANFCRRILKTGPNGAMTDMDLFAPVGLTYAMQVLDDPALAEGARAYARALFSHPRLFHPAGYWVDMGCYDVSYNGISLYYASWAAALNPQWDFAREALTQAFELRHHMTLPDLHGKYYGPSHMSSRTSADAPHDQWGFTTRAIMGAAVTDAALPNLRRSDVNALKVIGTPALDKAAETLVGQLNTSINRDTPITQGPWAEAHWGRMPPYPAWVITRDFYERLVALKGEDSPLLKFPAERPGTYIRNFADTVLSVKFDDYAAIIHTGPVGRDYRNSFYGFGGGVLSAFATPDAGPVVLGRRRGSQGAKADSWDEWRSWPVHATSGVTQQGGVISTARCRKPQFYHEQHENLAMVRVAGEFNAMQGSRQVLSGGARYTRHFKLTPEGVRASSTAGGDGAEGIAELYEMIPLMLGEPGRGGVLPPLRVRFQTAAGWADPGEDFVPDVRRIHVQRYEGAVEIRFATPQTVRFSPVVWTDGYQSRVHCRNLEVRLLEEPVAAGTRWQIATDWLISPAEAMEE